MTEYLRRIPDYTVPEFIETFDELPLWSARFGLLLLNQLELKPGIVGLDLACGAGFPLLELAQMHGAGCFFVGVDLWTHALRRADHKRQAHDVANAGLSIGDGGRLPFADATFDLITINLGLNNFDEPLPVLKECRRVLRPAGRLALTSNLSGHMRQFYAVLRQVLADQGMTGSLESLTAHEAHRGSHESITALLTESGLAVNRTTEESFTLRYRDGSAFLNHYMTRLGFMGGWKTVIPDEQHEPVFAEVERRLNALAAETGELLLTIPMIYVEAGA
jgi:arsenite methyltransferase